MSNLIYIKKQIELEAKERSDRKFDELVINYIKNNDIRINDWDIDVEITMKNGSPMVIIDNAKSEFWQKNQDHFIEQTEIELYKRIKND